MSQRLKLGVIGLGNVGELHVEAYQELLDEIDIVAAAELDARRLRHFADRYGFSPYSDYRQMLRAENLDMAAVLTPAGKHAEVTVACAGAGVHVLCEKPLAITLPAATEMIAACKKAGVKLCYGASYRFLPAVRKARELIQAGRLGDLLLLREQVVGGAGPASHRALGPVHYPNGGPGGSGMGLVDHGIHFIDTFTWLMGTTVESVFGRGDISGRTPQTEYMHINFNNGAVGDLLYNDGTFGTELPHEGIFSWGSGWDTSGYVQCGRWMARPGCIHVHGTKGALRIFYYANALFLITEGGIEQVPLAGRPAPGHFASQLQAFVKAIRENRSTEVPGEAGLDALRVLLATYESFHTGKLIRIAQT